MILYVNKFTLCLNGKKYKKGDSINIDEQIAEKLINENPDMFIKVNDATMLKDNKIKNAEIKEDKNIASNSGDVKLPEVDVKKTVKRTVKK